MSDRLTDAGLLVLGIAANKAFLAATMKDPVQLARAMNSLADRLTELAAGLPWSECSAVLQAIGRAALAAL